MLMTVVIITKNSYVAEFCMQINSCNKGHCTRALMTPTGRKCFSIFPTGNFYACCQRINYSHLFVATLSL